MDNKKVRLQVQGLSNSRMQASAYALILSEEGSNRCIPIVVGVAEAQSIAIALENIMPPRPLTHDLFTAFANAFGIALQEVFIYKFEDGVFYAKILFSNKEQEVEIDSRTSDAIALALRMHAPIYTTEDILEVCSFQADDALEEEPEPEEDEPDLDEFQDLDFDRVEDKESLDKWLHQVKIRVLEKLLEEAIADENYENAKVLRDELARRKEEQAKSE